jgi:hypothetical protein
VVDLLRTHRGADLVRGARGTGSCGCSRLPAPTRRQRVWRDGRRRGRSGRRRRRHGSPLRRRGRDRCSSDDGGAAEHRRHNHVACDADDSLGLIHVGSVVVIGAVRRHLGWCRGLAVQFRGSLHPDAGIRGHIICRASC